MCIKKNNNMDIEKWTFNLDMNAEVVHAAINIFEPCHEKTNNVVSKQV